MVGIIEEVFHAWRLLREGLEKISTRNSYLGNVAVELLHTMEKFEEGKEGAILYCPFTLIEEDGSHNEALTMKLGNERTDIILTPKALGSQEKLLETLIHELLHAAGIIGEDEAEDEAIAEYLTKLIMLELSIDTQDEMPAPSTATKEIPQHEFEANPAHYLKECIEINLKPTEVGING